MKSMKILGMDWLSAHHAVLECFNKVVTLSILSKPMMRYQGDCSAVSPCLISALTARKLLAKGCQEILTYVWDTKKKVPVLEKIPVVKDFLDVFLEELPELFADKEIEFGIDVPQLFQRRYDRLKEIRGRIFLRGENCKTLEFMKFYMISKIEV